jgi:hypothetical protein
MGGILFLSCDRVIISGNFRTGNSASNWTLSFSSNNINTPPERRQAIKTEIEALRTMRDNIMNKQILK